MTLGAAEPFTLKPMVGEGLLGSICQRCSTVLGADHVRRSLHEATVSIRFRLGRNLHSVFRDVRYGLCPNSSLCSAVAGGHTNYRRRSSFVQRTQLEGDPGGIHHSRRLATTEYTRAMVGLRTMQRVCPATHTNANSGSNTHTHSGAHAYAFWRRRRQLRACLEPEPGLLQHCHHQLQWRQHGQQERPELSGPVLEYEPRPHCGG
jgi:hypothetical protein